MLKVKALFLICITHLLLNAVLSEKLEAQSQTISMKQQDEAFKKSVAKVVFFLSILSIGAYFLKKHGRNGKLENPYAGSIKLVDETLIKGTKYSLVEVLNKKILVVSNQTGALNMIELANLELIASESVEESKSQTKNIANLV